MRPGEWHDWDPDFKDFRNFVHLVWSEVIGRKPTRRQYEMAHFMQHGPPNQVLECMRGIGKSWLSATFVPWVHGWCPWIQFLVTSAAQTKSDEFSTFCQQLLETLPELAHILPDSPKRWSRVAFDVAGAQEAAQDASVRSRGIFGQITGGRAHIIIPDDVETPNTAETVGMRQKLRRRCFVEFSAILLPNPIERDRPEWVPLNGTRYLGTPHDQDSIYDQLLTRGFTLMVVPAEYPTTERRKLLGGRLSPQIAAELDADPALEGHATDERFPDEVLAQKRAEMGPSGYNMQMLLDTSGVDKMRHPLRLSDLVTFDLDAELGPERVVWGTSPEQAASELPCVGLHDDAFYRPFRVVGDLVKFGGCVVAVDPSGDGPDETAAAAVKELNAQLWLTGMFASTDGSSPATMQGIADLAKKHRAHAVVIEKNRGGELFAKLLTPYLRETHPCEIVLTTASRQKELRIADTLEPIMSQHRLGVTPEVVRWDYENVPDAGSDARVAYRLFYQMARLRRERDALPRDDRLDALASACAYWMERLGVSVESAAHEAQRRRAKELAEDLAKSLGSRRVPEPAMTWSRHRPANIKHPQLPNRGPKRPGLRR